MPQGKSDQDPFWQDQGKGTATVVAEKLQNRGWGLKGRGFSHAVQRFSKTKAREAVSLQNSNAREFFRKPFSRAARAQ